MVKVLTVREPWASLIAYGYKEYEFRNWKTNYRGELYIHAGKGFEKEYASLVKTFHLPISRGMIIAKAKLVDCIPVTSEFEDALIKKDEMVYGKSRGRGGYAWKLTEIELLEHPIPCNGKLSIWNYQEED